MINSLSFRQRPNNTTIQAAPQSLRSYAMLHSQPQRDNVSFGSINTKSFCRTLVEEHDYLPTIALSQIRPINIIEKLPQKPVEAYLGKITDKYSREIPPALVVFSKNGELLGDIRTLDTLECNATYKKPGYPEKYLRLHDLNASYSTRYRGIGTALIQAAIEESKKFGLDGQLRVLAYNNKAFWKGSPVPFYAKMGFVLERDPNMSKEKIIENYSHGSPCEGMFLLTPDGLTKMRNPIPIPKEVEKAKKLSFSQRILNALLGNLI